MTATTMPLILLNKPYRVLSQFRDSDGRSTLANFVNTPAVYSVGRLDFDSEGLLLLTDNGGLKHRISHPGAELPKTYLAQVEGCPNEAALAALSGGISSKGEQLRCVCADPLEPPALWPRDPPIRVRKSVPDSWLRIVLTEGKNRQVRRMTAAVGHPVLRLVRNQTGPWNLGDLKPGETRQLSNAEAEHQLAAYLRAVKR